MLQSSTPTSSPRIRPTWRPRATRVRHDLVRVRRSFDEGGLNLVAAKLLERASHRLMIRGATRTLERRQPGTLEEEIEFAFTFCYGDISIDPSQVREEFERLLGLLAQERPKTVLEIGTARGGTLFLYTRVATPDALLITIDLSDGSQTAFGGGNYAPRAGLYEAFTRLGQRVEFVVGDSHDEITRARIGSLLGDRPVDFLFIDGDHSYEGVKQDFLMYLPLVRPGGLVAFHDIVPGPDEAVGGAPAFWREIRNADAIEFIADPDQGGFGLGVLRA